MFLPIQDDFTPDAPLLEGGNNGSTDNRGGPTNVIHTGRGFSSFGQTTVITSTSGIGDRALGRFSFRASNGTYYTFGGIDDALKLVSGTTWDDVTRTVGGAYATASGDTWNFISFGNRVIAVNYTDDVQTYLAGTDTDFSALAGSPPKAKYITVSGDFVVLAYINDGTVYPHRIRWSAQGDPTASWATSASTQSDIDDLDSNNGVITGVVGFADYFYVFQERAITRYDYVGSPLVYRATEVSPGLGCIVPGSICRVGERVFFITREGFKELSGAGIRPIGFGKLDKHWWASLYSATNEANSISRITAVGDPNYSVVHFACAIGSDNVQNTIYSYNYLSEKWSITTPENTLNQLGVIYSSTFPYGTIAAFRSSDNKLYSLYFDAQSSVVPVFYTKPAQLSKDNNFVCIDKIRVIADGFSDTSTVAPIGTSADIAVTFPGYVAQTFSNLTQNASNKAEYDGRHTASYIRYKITGANNAIYGVKILAMSEDGKR
jgi:hypothetical protein